MLIGELVAVTVTFLTIIFTFVNISLITKLGLLIIILLIAIIGVVHLYISSVLLTKVERHAIDLINATYGYDGFEIIHGYPLVANAAPNGSDLSRSEFAQRTAKDVLDQLWIMWYEKGGISDSQLEYDALPLIVEKLKHYYGLRIDGEYLFSFFERHNDFPVLTKVLIDHWDGVSDAYGPVLRRFHETKKTFLCLMLQKLYQITSIEAMIKKASDDTLNCACVGHFGYNHPVSALDQVGNAYLGTDNPRIFDALLARANEDGSGLIIPNGISFTGYTEEAALAVKDVLKRRAIFKKLFPRVLETRVFGLQLPEVSRVVSEYMSESLPQ